MIKPLISNQYGALVMAFVPYLYGIFASEWVTGHFWLGGSWLFMYLFSYPFLVLFGKKPLAKYYHWAIIYAVLSLLFAVPLLCEHIELLQFLAFILPLVLVQIYYTKQKNERHLVNDIAGILIFGVVGVVSFYLATTQYNGLILLEPSLFFIATTLYIKSAARERKNGRYRQASLMFHLCLALGYLILEGYFVSVFYFLALLRAAVIPKLGWNLKKMGLLEFAVTLGFLISLVLDLN